jgi:hypothetical protein
VACDQPVNDFYLSRTSVDHARSPYLPPHIIYIGQGYSEGIVYLLLDTELGLITSYPNYGGDFPPPDFTFEEYEGLAPEQTWHAHPTLQIKAFCEREALRLKPLVSMPVPRRGRDPSFYLRAEWPAKEAALLTIEAEFDEEHDTDADYEEDEEDEEQQDGREQEDLRLSGDEDGGEHEAAGEEVLEDELEWLRHNAEQALYQAAPRLDLPEPKPLPDSTKVNTMLLRPAN